MLYVFKQLNSQDYSDYVLIIPSVSVGNVPQLTADLLISTLQLQKAAIVWHPAIIPCVGRDAFISNGSDLTTACELYSSSDDNRKLAVLQIRSGIVDHFSDDFFKQLTASILHLKFKRVVFLCSSFDYELNDIAGNKFFYYANEDISETMKECGIEPLKKQELNDSAITDYVVHSGGFVLKLYKALQEKLLCAVLIHFVSEGDNRPDAISMFTRLMRFLECVATNVCCIRTVEIVYPHSWQLLFGGPAPSGLLF